MLIRTVLDVFSICTYICTYSMYSEMCISVSIFVHIHAQNMNSDVLYVCARYTHHCTYNAYLHVSLYVYTY